MERVENKQVLLGNVVSPFFRFVVLFSFLYDFFSSPMNIEHCCSSLFLYFYVFVLLDKSNNKDIHFPLYQKGEKEISISSLLELGICALFKLGRKRNKCSK